MNRNLKLKDDFDFFVSFCHTPTGTSFFIARWTSSINVWLSFLSNWCWLPWRRLFALAKSQQVFTTPTTPTITASSSWWSLDTLKVGETVSTLSFSYFFFLELNLACKASSNLAVCWSSYNREALHVPLQDKSDDKKLFFFCPHFLPSIFILQDLGWLLFPILSSCCVVFGGPRPMRSSTCHCKCMKIADQHEGLLKDVSKENLNIKINCIFFIKYFCVESHVMTWINRKCAYILPHPDICSYLDNI